LFDYNKVVIFANATGYERTHPKKRRGEPEASLEKDIQAKKKSMQF